MQRFGKCAWLLIAAFPALLSAQGFGIYEQGTCTMGRAGTAAAAPCPDGSAIFFNPAGLAGLKGGHVSAGVTIIKVMGGFTDDVFAETTDLNDPILYVPQVYASYAVTPKMGVGIGVFAPYGLQTRWPLTFDGRFSGYDNIIKTIYVQPTVAYQVTKWLKLGGGFDIVHGSVELHQRATYRGHRSPAFPVRRSARSASLRARTSRTPIFRRRPPVTARTLALSRR